MAYRATISGHEVWFDSHHVSGDELARGLSDAVGVKDDAGCYYVPRQNRPDGRAFRSGTLVCLLECSDFVLAPVVRDDRFLRGWNDNALTDELPGRPSRQRTIVVDDA